MFARFSDGLHCLNLRDYLAAAQSDWDRPHEAGEIECPHFHCGGVGCGGQDNFDEPETETQISKYQK